jgi:hypothetical protein
LNLLFSLQQRLWKKNEWMSEWLLFNANSVIFLFVLPMFQTTDLLIMSNLLPGNYRVLSISSISVGCICFRNKMTQKGLDSYQEEDLTLLRDRWSETLARRKEKLLNWR